MQNNPVTEYMRLDELHLLDIIEAADYIRKFTDDYDEEKFMLDHLVQSAVLQKLTVIGESTAKLSQKIKDSYDGVPWDDMLAYKDIGRNPSGVSWSLVWVTAIIDIPENMFAVRDILKKEFRK